MLDFKLKLLFNMYKDKSLPNREKFRAKIKKKHPNFPYVEELILMIEKYNKFKKFLINIYHFI